MNTKCKLPSLILISSKAASKCFSSTTGSSKGFHGLLLISSDMRRISESRSERLLSKLDKFCCEDNLFWSLLPSWSEKAVDSERFDLWDSSFYLKFPQKIQSTYLFKAIVSLTFLRWPTFEILLPSWLSSAKLFESFCSVVFDDWNNSGQNVCGWGDVVFLGDGLGGKPKAIPLGRCLGTTLVPASTTVKFWAFNLLPLPALYSDSNGGTSKSLRSGMGVFCKRLTILIYRSFSTFIFTSLLVTGLFLLDNLKARSQTWNIFGLKEIGTY